MLHGLDWAGRASVVRHILIHAWPPRPKFSKIYCDSGPWSALQTLDLRVASLVYGVLHLVGAVRVIYNCASRLADLAWLGLRHPKHLEFSLFGLNQVVYITLTYAWLA